MVDRGYRTGASLIRTGQSNGLASPSRAPRLEWDPMLKKTPTIAMRFPADIAGESPSGMLKIKDSYGRMRKLAL